MIKPLNDYRFIDIHYHANPDLYLRRWSAIDIGRRYQALDAAVVLKSHLGSTAVQATLAQMEGLPVFPSVVLNHIAGGIDYRVIMRALSEYTPVVASKLVVHFPTITGRSYHAKLQRKLVHNSLGFCSQRAETLFNNEKRLRKEVIDILKMSADFPIVLSTGHASKEEVYALVDACDTYHVPQLILNQPANPLTGLDFHELLALSKSEKLWFEQTALTYLLGHQTKEDFKQVLKELPQVIYSSDLGQTSQMDLDDWRVASDGYFKEFGLSLKRADELSRINAIKLLSL